MTNMMNYISKLANCDSSIATSDVKKTREDDLDNQN